MDQKQYEEIRQRLSQGEDEKVTVVMIDADEVKDLTEEQAGELVAEFGSNTLTRLPKKELEFFDWLKENDPDVWHDLWDEDEEYLVSLSHLESLLPGRRGFPICDLVSQTNFFFDRSLITDQEGDLHLKAALDVVQEQGQLTLDQAFLVEVWRAPIDQWRFAWMYRVPLADVKAMVLWLIQEEVLLAPPQRDDDDETEPPVNGVDG